MIPTKRNLVPTKWNLIPTREESDTDTKCCIADGKKLTIVIRLAREKDCFAALCAPFGDRAESHTDGNDAKDT